MAVFAVKTAQSTYQNVVERGVLQRAAGFIPESTGKLFVVTTEDVWRLHGEKLRARFAEDRLHVLFFPGGESNKRMAMVETLAEQMMELGADRTSL
ncbi:MAG TPA: hypothetical protein VK604_20295, partial [Bryobacteraceae bacterium]|nr:hypothetical protein [Bryobacteraceae bacterium]